MRTATLVSTYALVGLALAPAALRAQTSYADIAPVLAARCVICHAGEAAPLGLRLDSMENLLQGSNRGPVVKAGDAANSELLRRLKGTSLPRMPMTGPPFLSDAEIARFEQWIAGGLARGAGMPATSEKPPAAAQAPLAVTYAQVAPIFATRCAKCHTENGLMGPAPEGYKLVSYADTLSAPDRLRVVPGNPGASELVRRVRGQARPRMPFDGPPYLSETEIGLIEQWVLQGAQNAEGKSAAVPAGARVRLHGTLTERWFLDGTPLDAGAGMRIDKSPRTGDYVEVRGRVDGEGKVTAERIRPR